MNEELKQLILSLANLKDADEIIQLLDLIVELKKYKRLWETFRPIVQRRDLYLWEYMQVLEKEDMEGLKKIMETMEDE